MNDSTFVSLAKETAYYLKDSIAPELWRMTQEKIISDAIFEGSLMLIIGIILGVVLHFIIKYWKKIICNDIRALVTIIFGVLSLFWFTFIFVIAYDIFTVLNAFDYITLKTIIELVH